MMKTEDNICGVVDQIIRKVEKFGGMERLGCIFDTSQQSYFYDSGTGKVERLEEEEAQFFKWLFIRKPEDGYEQWLTYNCREIKQETILGIWQTIENEHLLENPYPSHMYSKLHQEQLKDILQAGIRMITLELTGKCNLRCGYCIYNEKFCENRNFTDCDMSEETARKAIDFLAEHGEKDVAVTFYGGEPLLKFALIEKCVAYAQSKMPDRNLTYSITSNATLLTREMAEYFYSIKSFNIVVSLDGPQEIHDAYRKYPNGKGSFEDTLRGLKILADVFGEDFAKRVSISTVFAPPYTYEHLEKVDKFFTEQNWIPKEMQKLLSYPENGSVEYSLEESDGVDYDDEQDRGYINTINEWTQARHAEEKIPYSDMVTQKLYDDILLRIHKRVLTNEASDLYGLNGCCVPGARRLYVTTEGTFKPCDRIGVCPAIGDVDRGMDYDAIRKLYVEDYIAASEDCNNCWAKRMCGVCYAKVYSYDKISPEKKKYACMMARYTTKDGLIRYHSQLEKDPEGLNYLNEIQYG